MSKFMVLINTKRRRRWYWPFVQKPIRIQLGKKARIVITQEGFENPVLVECYEADNAKLTTIVSCGNEDDGVKKVRFKLVSEGHPRLLF